MDVYELRRPSKIIFGGFVNSFFFSAEMDGNRLRANVETKLQRLFPFLRQNEVALADSAGSVLEILGLSHLEAGNGPLLSVMNCRQVDTFGNLSSMVIQSAIISSTTST